MRFGIVKRTVQFLALVAVLAAVAAPASARAAGQTDILLLFDTSGSMEGALEPAVEDISDISDQLRAELGDVAFGVAEVRDYPLSIFSNGGGGDRPYDVVEPVTTSRSAVEDGLDDLFATGGGDGPEAYGRALRDADLGRDGLGWRPGARRLVILVADNVPHDDDLNWGIPEALHAESSPFDTIEDPGDDEVVGNDDDIDWQTLLGELADNGLPLMFVLFEGDDDYLPYWQIWAGWTGGGAASADADDLTDIVLDLARRGANATLPYCPPGQSRDGARRCRPYWEWLGYSFKNKGSPSWAKQAGLSRDDVLAKHVVERTFSDVNVPYWWAFWRNDPRAKWWDDMTDGTCYGMALTGSRFSTGLDLLPAPAEGRSANTWASGLTPSLPGPVSASDGGYRRELLQTLAAAHLTQESTEARADLLSQEHHFARAGRNGKGMAALRGQLESVMSTGRSKIGPGHLASESPMGLALLGIYYPGGGHAVVAYDVRDTSDGGFQIEVWDNERPREVSSLVVKPDGTWEYPPFGWSGGPAKLAILPAHPPRNLHFQTGGKTSNGPDVTIADLPASARRLSAKAQTGKGKRASLAVQPVFAVGPGREGRAVVTDSERLQLSFNDKQAGATARGSGRIMTAEGLTGTKGGRASIAYDVKRAMVSTKAPRTGALAVVRGARRASTNGATALAMAKSGAITARAARGGRVSISLSSDVRGPLASATIKLRLPRNGVARIDARQAKRAIRRGGRVKVRVRRGKRRRAVRVRARTAASRYRLRARVRIKRRRAKLRLSTRQRIPRGAQGRVVWVVKRGKKLLRRKRVRLKTRRARAGRVVSAIRLPKRKRRLTVKAKVRVVVKRPAPAELRAVGTRRVRRGR